VTTKCRFVPDRPLQPGGRYLWEVDARGPNGPVGVGLGEFRVGEEQEGPVPEPPALRQAALPDGPALRVATYNVNWGCPATDETLGVLAAMQADIVCVQETNAAWERLIRVRLGRVYPVMWFHDDELPAGGMAVLSKWPVSRPALLPSDSGWFDAARFVADTPLGRLQVLSLHLQPVTISYEGFSLRAWLASAEARRAEVERFGAAIVAEMPTIVLGDLNEGDTGLAVMWLKDRGFTNALPAFQPAVPTWEWPVGSMTLRLQIDHILHSADLVCHSAHVLNAGGSDHFPVIATLSRN
jgi:endonuclease/exonuclease/phosphatase family metal-dependent hydrolase